MMGYTRLNGKQTKKKRKNHRTNTSDGSAAIFQLSYCVPTGGLPLRLNTVIKAR